jgi:hypothetical protein
MQQLEFKGEKGLLDSIGLGSSDSGDNSQLAFTQDAVEVVLAIGEGPIQGLVDGLKSFYVGETPLLAADGTPNFYDKNGTQLAQSFWLAPLYGTPEGQPMASLLGGFGSATNVNVPFATNTPLVRTVTHHNIDFVDVRLLINSLYLEGDNGSSSPYLLAFRIEWKRASDASYNPIIPIFDVQQPTTGEVLIDRGIRAFWQSTPPSTAGIAEAVWFDSSNNDQPNLIVNGSWVSAPMSAYTNSTINIPDDAYWKWEEIALNGTVSAPRAWQGNDADLAKLLSPLGSPRKGDYWLVTDLNLLRYYNGGGWVTANDGTTAAPPPDTAFVGSGTISVSTRITSSPVVWQTRFPVPNIDEDLNVRVTKLTASTSDISKVHSDTTWESFTATVKEIFSYPNLALIQFYIIATNNFTSIPDFSGIYYGRIIKVPSNYNAVTRVYTGVWDGTWVMAYTDNPAYIVKDLVENTTYGLGAYYQVTLSDWDVYDAGVWCDHITPDGSPRFTFNGVISDPRVGREAIDYICGIFAGRFVDDGNGFARILIDRSDKPAVQLFTKENISGGAFTYGYTDVTTRYNDLTIVFINPNNSWTEDRRRLYSQPAIDEFGRIPYNFIAYGCISELEAYRRGRYVLITGQTETETVTFKTARNGAYIQPYDIILVADDAIFGKPPSSENLSGYFLETNGSAFPVLEGDNAHDVLLIGDYNAGNSIDPFSSLQTGRTLVNQSSTLASVTSGLVNATGSILTTTDAKTVILRDPVYLEPGFQYKVTFQTVDGPVEYTIDSSWTGTKSDLKVTTNITHTLPDRAAFALRVSSLAALPKPYRVISIKAEDSDQIEVTAIAVNRNKWYYVDGVPECPVLATYTATSSDFPAASFPTGCRAAVDWTGRVMYCHGGYGSALKLAKYDLDTHALLGEFTLTNTAGVSTFAGEILLWCKEQNLIIALFFGTGGCQIGLIDPATMTVTFASPGTRFQDSSIGIATNDNSWTYCINGGKLYVGVPIAASTRFYITGYNLTTHAWDAWQHTGNQLNGLSPAAHVGSGYYPLKETVRTGANDGFYVTAGTNLVKVALDTTCSIVATFSAEITKLYRAGSQLIMMLDNSTMVSFDTTSSSVQWIRDIPSDFADVGSNAGGDGGTHDQDVIDSALAYFHAGTPTSVGLIQTCDGASTTTSVTPRTFSGYTTFNTETNELIVTDGGTSRIMTLSPA